jgi:hypothetical protein
VKFRKCLEIDQHFCSKAEIVTPLVACTGVVEDDKDYPGNKHDKYSPKKEHDKDLNWVLTFYKQTQTAQQRKGHPSVIE